jgi:hypothetical protein
MHRARYILQNAWFSPYMGVLYRNELLTREQVLPSKMTLSTVTLELSTENDVQGALGEGLDQRGSVQFGQSALLMDDLRL